MNYPLTYRDGYLLVLSNHIQACLSLSNKPNFKGVPILPSLLYTGNEIKPITIEEANYTPHFQNDKGEFFIIDSSKLPKYFKCEMANNKPKVTTNVKGQKQWVGTYIY